MFKKIIRKIYPSKIFVGILCGIIFGVIFSVILRINFFSSIYWIVFAVLVFILAFWQPNYLFLGMACIAGITIGAFRVAYDLKDQRIINQQIGDIITITGTVKGDPDFSGTTGKVKIQPDNMHIVIYLSGSFIGLDNFNAEIQRGDRLTVSGKLSDGFGSYAGTIYRPTIKNIEKPNPGSLTLRFRDKLAKNVLNAMEEKEARLGLAYLAGMKNGLDDETIEILSLVGLTHLVVASGTHLGILVGFFKKYFGKISRFAGLLFSLIFIFLFGEMIGWTASITRAAIVAGLGILGWYAGRKIEGWRVILFAMTITLLINPMYLTDLGWLLSFASFIGIMLVEPILVQFFYDKKLAKPTKDTPFRKSKEPGAIAELVLASLSATATCTPILLYYFGSLSLISVVANLLILPTVPAAMGLTFFTGMIGFLPSGELILGIQKLIGWATEILLKYHLFVMNFFAKETEFLIQIPKGNYRVFWLYLPIILMIFCGSFVRAQKKRKITQKIRENQRELLRFS